MRTERVKEFFGDKTDIDARSFDFAGDVIKLVRDAGDRLPAVVGDRVMLMAAEIGENAAEALVGNNAERFLKRLTTARRQSRQIAYWLKLVDEAEAVPRDRIIDLLNNARELNKALTKLCEEAKAEKK